MEGNDCDKAWERVSRNKKKLYSEKIKNYYLRTLFLGGKAREIEEKKKEKKTPFLDASF